MLQSLASMPAAVLTGFIYDRTQNYTSALIVFVVSYCLSGLILWWLPDPERSSRVGALARQPANIQP
jgi:nitrate/nitrite transporter NarK